MAQPLRQLVEPEPGARPAPINVTRYYALVNEGTRYVRLLRTEAAYETAEDVADDMRVLEDAVRDLPTNCLLLDLRGGPAPRNDAQFEVAQRNWRASMQGRFQRIAVLVRSVVGVLQIQRLSKAEQIGARVFRDEAEAIAFLIGE